MSDELWPVGERGGRRVLAVGIGPGNPGYLTAYAQQAITQADMVAGFRTVLGPVEPFLAGDRLELTYRNQEEHLARLAEAARDGKRCVVCLWGDLNFSAGELLERVRRHCGPIGLVPGVSSVQIACARAGLAMEESLFVTLHIRNGLARGREEIVRTVLANERHVIALPLPWDFMPQAIAAHLVERRVPRERPAIVFERLTLPDEREHRLTLGELLASGHEFSDLSILVVPRADPANP